MIVFGEENVAIWTAKSVLTRPVLAASGVLGERPAAARREI